MLAANGGNMPQITPGGMVMMTLHQVNGDGAGPYECMIDSTGAGTQWETMQVATNVPGTNSRSQAKAQDFVSLPHPHSSFSFSNQHNEWLTDNQYSH